MPRPRISTRYSSPHTLRYFLVCVLFPKCQVLFSAHAEVFPTPLPSDSPRRTLLRTRGGISNIAETVRVAECSSPHTRRYFQLLSNMLAMRMLFSAHAEVFPVLAAVQRAALSLLRTRGGISDTDLGQSVTLPSSPHTRRYFHDGRRYYRVVVLFSAHAEVFPEAGLQQTLQHALLRTRGGISNCKH